LAPHPINRRGVFFPVQTPVKLAKGDQIDVELFIRSAELLFTWTVNVWEGSEKTNGSRVSKGVFRHSTFHGMLLSREGFVRTGPGFVPNLSARGKARRSVLELCDGTRNVREIEDEVFRRHSELFRTRIEAATFVAEVTTRYTD
jgi:hypothetical protein